MFFRSFGVFILILIANFTWVLAGDTSSLTHQFDHLLPRHLKQVSAMVARNSKTNPVSETLIRQIEAGSRISFVKDKGYNHLVLGDFFREGEAVVVNVFSIDSHPMIFIEPEPGDNILPKVLYGMVEGARHYLIKNPDVKYVRLQITNIVNEDLKRALIKAFGFIEGIPSERLSQYESEGQSRIHVEISFRNASCSQSLAAAAAVRGR